eukprot:3480218-Rhodomonas_salina.2
MDGDVDGDGDGDGDGDDGDGDGSSLYVPAAQASQLSRFPVNPKSHKHALRDKLPILVVVFPAHAEQGWLPFFALYVPYGHTLQVHPPSLVLNRVNPGTTVGSQHPGSKASSMMQGLGPRVEGRRMGVWPRPRVWGLGLESHSRVGLGSRVKILGSSLEGLRSTA